MKWKRNGGTREEAIEVRDIIMFPSLCLKHHGRDENSCAYHVRRRLFGRCAPDVYREAKGKGDGGQLKRILSIRGKKRSVERHDESLVCGRGGNNLLEFISCSGLSSFQLRVNLTRRYGCCPMGSLSIWDVGNDMKFHLFIICTRSTHESARASLCLPHVDRSSFRIILV